MVQSTTMYRLVTDQVGSVRLVVNTATGAIAERYAGEVVNPLGTVLASVTIGAGTSRTHISCPDGCFERRRRTRAQASRAAAPSAPSPPVVQPRAAGSAGRRASASRK